MSTDEKTDDAVEEKEESAESTKSSKSSAPKPNRILLVPYPKFVFLYPTFVVAAIATLVLYFGGHHAVDPSTQSTPVFMTGLFLVVMMTNMFIIVFDFPRANSLILVLLAIVVAGGIWAMGHLMPDFLPSLSGMLRKIQPAANATFFLCITIGMGLMYGAVMISVRFNYWELRNNELLHHHGFLSDLKRYPAPNLRVDKEINDIFEFVLLGSGRLILHPTTEKRAIVLDNILFVGTKERELTKMLGSIKVKIGTDSGIS